MSYYIKHHGILGQRWGVRRYQNEDGSLTEMGRKKAKQYRESLLKSYDKKIDKAVKDEKRVKLRKQKEYINKESDRELLDELERVFEMTAAANAAYLSGIPGIPTAPIAHIEIPDVIRARNFEQKFLTEHGNKTIHEIYEEMGYNPYSEREIKKLQRA